MDGPIQSSATGRLRLKVLFGMSGRWQAPAAVLPEGPKDQVESHSRARRAREWLKPASPRARRARGRAKLSRRLPVLLYVFHDSAKNRDFHGTI